jgi:GNAT superfamily N-acetyltransferase
MHQSDLSLSLANYDDVPHLVRMIKSFAALYPFPFEPDDLKIEAVIRKLMDEGVVIVSGDPPIGFIMGGLSEFIYNTEVVATELTWWVDEEYRNTKVGLALFTVFEEWAKNQGATIIQMSSAGRDMKDWYTRRGYTPSEASFYKRIS